MTQYDDLYGLPLQGRAERKHLYEWMTAEERYVAAKFDDQRNGHDDSMATHDLNAFWAPQIIQYLGRAQIFLDGAAESTSAETRRALELRAQQALAKGMMTFKGCVESSIRTFGPLPKAGLPSGEIVAHP